MIIGILIFLAFLFFLTKALLETVWGLGLIALGVFWHIVGRFLDVLIWFSKRVKKSQKIQVTQQFFIRSARSQSI